ncbi:cora-domain-containing protein [Didymella exigua CBS 183.55]|uniref:Magnesium transporter n=1 Tax=Didymella exigua CBS 183.55 TaxID=1150837 RepID=A0A6A5RDS4_9PLEO|nr:cora-domain-containing protein [Didymella exigua CBS 183.55]KAF1925470.1 cora-domain-containing protein [Didymella exigua CBS 183.55]
MQPNLLRKVAAPSPSVLSFLRAQVNHAFESPAGQCAGLKRQRRAYTASSPCTVKPSVSSTRGFSTSRPCSLLQPPVSPSSDDVSAAGSGYGNTLGRLARSANELKMRCTELDEHGNVTLVSGEFKKSELIAKYGLLPRDLRKIDSSLLPHILVRPSAILINLLNLRVLLKHNRVLVFDAYGTTDSKSQSVFMYDLDLKLRQKESVANGTLAYEFRALEAVLISVTLSLEKEFEGVSEPVVRVLRELEEDIDRDKLRYLLIYSKKLGSFEQKARLVRNALEELLEADDDLSAMYLSEKAEGKTREDDDHTEVEMLLESYHKVADEIVQAAENLVSSIRNTEEIVKAILDANRNSLMLLDLRFSILTLAITAGTFVAALYGMNLKNFIEETDFGFYGVSAWCTVFGAIVAVYGLQKLRRVQRVSMYAHGPGSIVGTKPKSIWGLGAWGGARPVRGVGESGGETGGVVVGKPKGGDALRELIHRDRHLARKVAKAEGRAGDVAGGGL